MNDGRPPNVSRRSVPAAMSASLSRRATWAAPITSGSAPNVFEIVTRTCSPPALVWTISRSVSFVNCSGVPATPAGAVAHVPVQV